MKSLVVVRAGQLDVREIAPPDVGPYDALVKIEVCGICNSTDAKLIDGTMYWAPPFPITLGHESVGTVVKAGPRVRKFKVGDRVTRPVSFWPGSRKDLNPAMGGFSEYGIVRDGLAMADDGDPSLKDDYTVHRQLIAPKSISPVEAALSISLAECASVYLTTGEVRGRTIVIAGTGVAGLAFVLWGKLAGARVICLGRRDERLAKAKELGADVGINTTSGDVVANIERAAGGKADGMIEATGDAPLASKILGALKPGGFATAYGVPPTGVKYDSRWAIPDVQEHKCYAWVADLISRRWVKPEWFVSHRWKFDQVIDAFAQSGRGEVVKGFVEISTS